MKFKLDSDYMSWQHEVTAHMRAILVDWLVEVQENFELNHETLYLAVKFIDHYMAREQTPKLQLQLVGATAMFLAGKFDVSSSVVTAYVAGMVCNDLSRKIHAWSITCVSVIPGVCCRSATRP